MAGTQLGYSGKLGIPSNWPFMTIDGSSQYFRWAGNVPQKLYKLAPKSRILLLLRNPIDRLYSNYWMNHAQSQRHKELYPSFRDYIQKSHWRSDSLNTYAKNLRRWYTVFSREQIMIINSFDFFRDTQRILNNIFRFLGLTPFRVSDLSPIIPFAKLNTPPSKHYPPIGAEERELLARHFEPLNKELYMLVGTDFGWK
jgi:hypothetical protein